MCFPDDLGEKASPNTLDRCVIKCVIGDPVFSVRDYLESDFHSADFQLSEI